MASRPSTEAVAPAPYASPLAEELAEDVLERFLRYVRIDTQGAYRTSRRPSTEKQLDLSRVAREFLRKISGNPPFRFDIVSIYFEVGRPAEIQLFKNAFAMG